MLDGICVDLKEMMSCRERRAQLQAEFLEKYHVPILSFCLNIPGPVKTNGQLAKVFDAGKIEIMNILRLEKISMRDFIEFHENTGDELLYALDVDAEVLKGWMYEVEENHPLGRLFDIDIIGTDGNKLSRSQFRKCLLCDCQAQECARSRKHSVAEMQDKIAEMTAHL